MRPLPRLIPASLLLAALLVGSSCSGSSNSTAKFCDVYKKAKTETNGLKSTDLASAKKTSTITLDKLTKVDHAAPSEVKPDVDKVLAAYKKVDATFQGAKSEADLTKVGDALRADQKSVQASSDRLKAYTKKNCGVSASDSTVASS